MDIWLGQGVTRLVAWNNEYVGWLQAAWENYLRLLEWLQANSD